MTVLNSVLCSYFALKFVLIELEVKPLFRPSHFLPWATVFAVEITEGDLKYASGTWGDFHLMVAQQSWGAEGGHFGMPNPREEEKWEAGLTVSEAQRRTEDLGGQRKTKQNNKQKQNIHNKRTENHTQTASDLPLDLPRK